MRRGKPESTEKGKHGVGTLVKINTTMARIDFEDGAQTEIYVSDQTFPEILLNVFNKMPEKAKINVDITLDTTEEKVMFVRPLVGTFDFKFIKFFAPKDTPPVMETKIGKGNKPYKQFSAVLEVQNKTGVKSDLWRGARFSVFFFDAFGKDEDGNLLVQARGEASDFLSDFLDVIGVGNLSIPYSENPLPEIEKLATQANTTFSADVRKVTNKGKSYANVVMFNTFSASDDFFDDDYPDTESPETEVRAIVNDTSDDEDSVDKIHPALVD